MKTTTLLLVHAGLLPACRAARKCYFPNGKPARDYHMPCDPDAIASPCCPWVENFNGTCLENYLCPGMHDVLYTPACTYEALGTSLCPNYCPRG